jgi:hypothetical protein
MGGLLTDRSDHPDAALGAAHERSGVDCRADHRSLGAIGFADDYLKITRRPITDRGPGCQPWREWCSRWYCWC